MSTTTEPVTWLYVTKDGEAGHLAVRDCDVCGALVNAERWTRHTKFHQRERRTTRARGTAS